MGDSYWGEVIEAEPQVAARLLPYLQQAPNYARYFQVALDAKGYPPPEAAKSAAQTKVMVEVQLQRQHV
jgi:hypothetical protein